MNNMSEKTFLSIKGVLDQNKITYEFFEHAPVITSEDAARVRKAKLCEGVKAMMLKHDSVFVMITLPADRKIDFDKVKEQLQTKNLRFATLEEVKEVIDCERGGVPPFGFLFSIQTLVDKKISENEKIEFNAGLTTKSIKMNSADYFNIASKSSKVIVGEFAQ